jgi:predicted DNA-binding ribbon-helix-helix protein
MTMPLPGTLPSPARAASGLLGGWDASAAQKPRKRSLAIAGHRTSISLEQPFWDGLRAVALEKGVPIAALVAAIDAVRGEASLSSAIRLFVYDHHSGRNHRLA